MALAAPLAHVADMSPVLHHAALREVNLVDDMWDSRIELVAALLLFPGLKRLKISYGSYKNTGPLARVPSRSSTLQEFIVYEPNTP
jgi:hypothetical protein